MKYRYRVGMLVRREFRAYLDTIETPWAEHKGWFSSFFVVRANPAQRKCIDDWMAWSNKVEDA